MHLLKNIAAFYCLLATSVHASNNHESNPTPIQSLTTHMRLDLNQIWAAHVKRKLLEQKPVLTVKNFCIESINPSHNTQLIHLCGTFLSYNNACFEGTFMYNLQNHTISSPQEFQRIPATRLKRAFNTCKQYETTPKSYKIKIPAGVVTFSQLTYTTVDIQETIISQ